MTAAEPAVIDALVTAFKAAYVAADEDAVTVVDGPTGEPQFAGAATLAVGTQNDDTGDPAAEVVAEPSGLTRQDVTGSVNCELTVLGDGMDIDSFSPTRARVYALFDLALAAVPGVTVPRVLSVRVGQRSLTQRRISKGPLARIQFAVDFQAIE